MEVNPIIWWVGHILHHMFEWILTLLILYPYQDDTRKKAASTYLVENTDMPPPRYQKDGTLPINYPNNTPNSG